MKLAVMLIAVIMVLSVFGSMMVARDVDRPNKIMPNTAWQTVVHDLNCRDANDPNKTWHKTNMADTYDPNRRDVNEPNKM